MKIKQLDAIKAQHNRYQQMANINPPEIGGFITAALVNHEPLKLKSEGAIVQLCREKIAKSDGYRCDRSLSFADLFDTCPAYVDAMNAYKNKKFKLDFAVKEYLKKAEPLLRKAELNDEAEPEEIAQALSDAAREAKLI